MTSTAATVSIRDLIARAARGERRAVAQLLTDLERQGDRLAIVLQHLQTHIRGSVVIGITGPPGAGKSTLVNALIAALRADGSTVGILAIDPSSPVSGGAILGDRLRMTAAASDDGVFVRSLAAGGHLGGLTPAAVRMIDGLDASGFDPVLIETVGTGQNEIDVAEIADIRIVVVAPGLGDDIQAMKSGLLEIADIMVVNKADRGGAEETRQQLAGALSLRAGNPGATEVLAVSARTGDGIAGLVHRINTEITRVRGEPAATRRLRRGRYLLAQAAHRLIAARLDDPSRAPANDRLARAIVEGQLSTAACIALLLSGADAGDQTRNE